MPSTHLSLHYHVVFSTKERHPFISHEWQERLHAYLGGIIRDLGGVPECVGGITDHIHLLIGLKATHRLCDVLRDIKVSSSRWVHEAMDLREFAWQDGYGAFTVSENRREAIKLYILNQETHHRTRSFQDEYLAFLRQAGVEFDERYLW
ncbi:MAG: IS200/IS605 family transposase [Geobacteraceae bacterium]|nr:IS200/IS605 family transposase [Geobacteraceae bacterium]